MTSRRHPKSANARFAEQERRMTAIVSERSGRSTRRLRTSAAIVLIGLVATLAAGCKPRLDDQLHPQLTDPARRHPIVVVAETATLDVPFAGIDEGTSARTYVETSRFVRNYRNEGRGPLRIAVPYGSSGATRQARAVQVLAHRAGISPQQMRVVGKPGGGTITLSYDRIAAIGPTCGDWSEDVTRNREFLPYNNFGCASQRNIAAMAANPTDLMYPAAEPLRGSDTRAQDHKNFTQGIGKAPAAAKQ